MQLFNFILSLQLISLEGTAASLKKGENTCVISHHKFERDIGVLNYNEIDIHQILERYKGQEICYCPNPGNAGDALIAHSTYNLFLKYKIKCSQINVETHLTENSS